MDIPRVWRLRPQRYRLVGTRCEDCGGLQFPPAKICPECRNQRLESYQFAGRGTVFSFSTVYSPLPRFEEMAPYVVALIDLEEGPRVAAQITDAEPTDIEIGMPVEMVIRKLSEEGKRGVITYAYKFRPVLGTGSNNH